MFHWWECVFIFPTLSFYHTILNNSSVSSLNYGNSSFCVIGNLKVHYIHPLQEKVLQLMMIMTKISVLNFMIIHLDHLNHQHICKMRKIKLKVELKSWLDWSFMQGEKLEHCLQCCYYWIYKQPMVGVTSTLMHLSSLCP